jgi:hypothetical protein
MGHHWPKKAFFFRLSLLQEKTAPEHALFVELSASERKPGIAEIYIQPRNKKNTCSLSLHSLQKRRAAENGH